MSPRLKEILIGVILGDVNICKQKTSVNARLKFDQGTVHKDYLLHLFELFSDYCSMVPKTIIRAPDNRTGKEYSNIFFSTRSLPCFLELYNLFYPAGSIKIVPLNIAELLTPIGLAYWICDDGLWDKHCRRVVLCTDSFTLKEVNLLIKVLNDKFDLKCFLYNNGTGFRIIIPPYSISALQTLLAPVMPAMMRHKINL